MPTNTIGGAFVEAGAGPMVAWTVEAWRFNDIFGWELKALAATDGQGRFTLQFTPTGQDRFTLQFTPTGTLPSVPLHEVRLVSDVGRTIHRLTLPLSDGGTHDFGPISVHARNIRGYLATNLDPNGVAVRLSSNNSVEPMIDNVAAWSALHAAIGAAAHEILLQLFYFDVNQVFVTFTHPLPLDDGTPTIGTRLEEDLLAANIGRGVTVRLLIRDHTPLPYPIHTANEVVNYFAAAPPASTIQVRRYWTDPRLPMHAKFAIIDGVEAHLTTSPFLQEYYDGPQHSVDDPRRGRLSTFGNTFDAAVALEDIQLLTPPPGPLPVQTALWVARAMKNSIRVPVHDVGARIRGAAVYDIKSTFFDHWNVAGAPAVSNLPSVPAAGPQSSVQIVRSLPRATFPGLPEGEASILESYLRCFAEAQQFIYLENQYLTELRIFNAIRLALLDPARPNLQVILLINRKVDIPLYQGWQAARMIQLVNNLTKDGTIGRFGAFTLWTHDPTAGAQRIISTYVHTKAAVADDRWATVGSANLDGVSLMTGEHLIPFTKTPGIENRRATEISATVFNGIDGQGASTVPGDLRRALWAEHLGLSGPAAPELAAPPAGGWLSLWQSRAEFKLISLTDNPPTFHPCRILTWRPEVASADYLKVLGVDTRQITALDEFRSFDFATGHWV